MLKIKKVLPYVIAFLIALGLPMAIWKTMPGEKKHTTISSESGHKESVIEVTSIEQSFKAVDDKLSSLALYVQPLLKGNKSIINVKLLDSEGKSYVDKDIHMATANPRPLLKIDFPAIENSNNKEFVLRISKASTSKSHQVQLYTNGRNEYKEGLLKKDGIPQEKDISLNTYYSKTKVELLNYMVSQLPVSKTAFLIIAGLFVIILFLFIKESLKILE